MLSSNAYPDELRGIVEHEVSVRRNIILRFPSTAKKIGVRNIVAARYHKNQTVCYDEVCSLFSSNSFQLFYVLLELLQLVR